MKRVLHDLTGQRFGSLLVIGVDETSGRKTKFICQCDCGNIKSIRSDALIEGMTRSCGCLKKKQDKINLTANHSHKMSGTRIYRIWQGMKDRCYNLNDPRYHRYGGRGIEVCPEWKNDFAAFYKWAMENGYADCCTIDRMDNDKGYYPENCRWATIEQQCNNRSSCIYITIGNATKTLKQWCDVFGLNYRLVYARYKRNGFAGINELFCKGGDENESDI